jgi:branched-chain amino acid transport system substrate-binding protein
LSEPVMEAAGLDPEGATVAIQAGDDQSGQLGQAAFAAAFEEIGVEVVYNEANLPVAGGTTDYTPFVQAVLESDPDVVVLSLDFPGTIGMAGSLNAAGYDGVVESFVAYVPGLLDAQPDVAAALEGTYVNVQIPPQEDGTPAIDQIQEDLEAIGEEPFVNFGAAVGYWQADLFIAALSAAEEPTPEALSALMSEGFTYEGPEGYLDQLEFPTALTDPAPCSALVKVEGGEYQSAVPFECYEVVPLG